LREVLQFFIKNTTAVTATLITTVMPDKSDNEFAQNKHKNHTEINLNQIKRLQIYKSITTTT
jgi:hypothetical protein